MPSRRLTYLTVPFSLSLAACNQVPPPDPGDESEAAADDDDAGDDDIDPGDDDDTGDDDDDDDEDDAGGGDDDDAEPPSMYPLVDGATWTYVNESPGDGQQNEIVTMRQIDYDGDVAYEQVDAEDSTGQSTRSVLVRDGTQVLRVEKEIVVDGVVNTSVDYDPGFVRFDDAWNEVGQTVSLTYNRVETDSFGQQSAAERVHEFRVEAIGETVTVPAGTFSTTYIIRTQVQGENPGEVVELWYAAGVGKVRERRADEGKTEELQSFDIPIVD